MRIHGCVLVLMMLLLPGCITQIWTGASLVYDRHNVYKKMSDYSLSSRANYLVFHDEVFKQPNCVIDLAAFNGDLLLAGHVPTQAMREELELRVAHLSDYRHIYNEVVVARWPTQSLNDAWITAQIRTAMFADAAIDPHPFKVITSDAVVYLMGEVREDQARRVIYIARETEGVRKVVRLMKYYTFK